MADSYGVADYLLIQWRMAVECGYEVNEPALAFFRGIFQVSKITKQLSPDKDVLAACLGDIRLMGAFAQFKEASSPKELGSLMDKYAAAMLQLPEKIDEMLTAGAGGSARFKIRMHETPLDRRNRNSAAVVRALVVLAAAVGLILHRIAGAAGGQWAERLNFAAFGLMGAVVLWVASRIN